MARKKKEAEVKKGLDEWMGTYADMITLLFCFFVLLYAASTRDPVKFQYIFESIRSGGEFINVIVNDSDITTEDGDGETNSNVPPLDEGDGGDGGKIVTIGEGNDPDSFEVLYNWVSEAIETNNLQDSVEISGTNTRISICLDNDVLFDPDSATLKPSGREVLRLIAPAVSAVKKFVSSVQIIGHTADVKAAASPVNDWDLSALRASAVLKYFDFERMVESNKMKLEAFAQYRPIADNDTEAGRAKNRRVEIIINRNPADFIDSKMMEDILKHDYNQTLGMVDEEGNPVVPPKPTPGSIVDSIISQLEKKYGDDENNDNAGGGSVGPSVGDDPTNIPDSDYLPPEETGEGEESEAGGGNESVAETSE